MNASAVITKSTLIRDSAILEPEYRKTMRLSGLQGSAAVHHMELCLCLSGWVNKVIRKDEQPGFPIPNLCQVFDRYDSFGPEKWSQIDLVEHLLEFPLAMIGPTHHHRPWLPNLSIFCGFLFTTVNQKRLFLQDSVQHRQHLQEHRHI